MLSRCSQTNTTSNIITHADPLNSTQVFICFSSSLWSGSSPGGAFHQICRCLENLLQKQKRYQITKASLWFLHEFFPTSSAETGLTHCNTHEAELCKACSWRTSCLNESWAVGAFFFFMQYPCQTEQTRMSARTHV